jgi:hypothetical protein
MSKKELQQSKEAARKRAINEEKAALELNVLLAKTDHDRYEATKKQLQRLAEIEIQEGDLTASQIKIIREKLNIDLEALDADRNEALYNIEKQRFAMLAEISNTEEHKALAALQQTYQDRLKLAGEDAELRLAIEKWFENQKQELKDQAAAKQADADLKAFDDELRLEESRFNVEKRTQAEQQRFKLEQDIQYYKKRLELQQKYGNILTDGEVEIIQNTIKAIQRELDGIGQGEGGDFWSMIGINISPDKQQLIRDSTAFALSQIGQIIQARNQQAQAAAQAAQTEVNAAKSAYEKEAELMRKGEANRAAAAESEMRRAEESQKRAEKLAEKERKRAARLEGLAQAGNLLTASTKILSQAGIPLAIPFLSLLWGTFYAQRRMAAKATKETYGKGHFEMIDQGGSHASGNDVPLGIDHRNRRVERGEAFAVFNKKATAKYGPRTIRDFVNNINDLTVERSIKIFSNEHQTTNVPMPVLDSEGIKDILRNIEKQGSQSTYIDNQGRVVVQKGNSKRTFIN